MTRVRQCLKPSKILKIKQTMTSPFVYLIPLLLNEYAAVSANYSEYETNFTKVIANISHPGCGKQPKIRVKRIAGGGLAEVGEAPWLVSLNINGSHECGGAIINEQWILTAAHCVTPLFPPLVVVSGKTNLIQSTVFLDSKEYQVEKIFIHGNYCDDNLKQATTYDIALIKLKYKLQFSDYVQPVCLLEEGQQVDGKNAQLFGWGKTYHDDIDDINRALYSIKFPIMHPDECNFIGKLVHHKILKNEFCAGYLLDTGKDSCKGDSGGPLVVNHNDQWIAVGILSHGLVECENSLFPSFFLQISAYINWIANTMKFVVLE